MSGVRIQIPGHATSGNLGPAPGRLTWHTKAYTQRSTEKKKVTFYKAY